MAMILARKVAFVAVVVLTSCRDEVESVPLYDGEWMDVHSIGRERADTCSGTFAYADAYAGVLAAEFGVNGPIGTFLWYTPEDYDALLPCSERLPYPAACVREDWVHSAFFPYEHEMVHIAHYHSGWGPSVLTEGIAVYYSTEINDGREFDANTLTRLFAKPSDELAACEYEMAGRFAAFLIERYGLKAILEVCAMAGYSADGAQLSAAMQSVLGATPNDLILELSQEPSYCNDFHHYRSNVFACGVAAAAPSLGTFVGDELETSIEFGCGKPGTVGPFEGGEFYGQIVRTLSLDIPVDGIYLFDVHDESQQDQPVPEGIVMTLSQCAPCGDWAFADTEILRQTPLIADFEAGRYSVEIGMPEDYVGTVRFRARLDFISDQ